MDLELVVLTLALLMPLLWLVRQVHEGLQELFFLLTDHKTLAVYLFQILLLPGVVLHEFSHLLVAKLLRVRIRRISLQPQVQGQKIQMGAIVLDKPDSVRGLLIGLAPLVLGSVAIVLIGHHIFDVDQVIEAASGNDDRSFIDAVRAAFAVNDAWIWLYLIFSISNAMLPSESDRESIWPMVSFAAIIVVLVVLAGWGPELAASLGQPLEAALSLLLLAFGITLSVDLIFVGLISLLKASISAVTGRRLENRV